MTILDGQAPERKQKGKRGKLSKTTSDKVPPTPIEEGKAATASAAPEYFTYGEPT